MQLAVTGHSTQTANLMVVEANGGTAYLTVAGGGTVTIPTLAATTVTASGAVTVNDNVDINGIADIVQSSHLITVITQGEYSPQIHCSDSSQNSINPYFGCQIRIILGRFTLEGFY